MGLGLVEISAVDKARAEKLQPRPVASSGHRKSREAAMRRELEGKDGEGWQEARAGRQGSSIREPRENSGSDPKGRGNHRGGSGRGVKWSDLSLRKSMGAAEGRSVGAGGGGADPAGHSGGDHARGR